MPRIFLSFFIVLASVAYALSARLTGDSSVAAVAGSDGKALAAAADPAPSAAVAAPAPLAAPPPVVANTAPPANIDQLLAGLPGPDQNKGDSNQRVATAPPPPPANQRSDQRVASLPPQADNGPHPEEYYLNQPPPAANNRQPPNRGRDFAERDDFDRGRPVGRNTPPPQTAQGDLVPVPRPAPPPPPVVAQATPAPTLTPPPPPVSAQNTTPPPAPAAPKPKFKDGSFTGPSVNAYFGLVQVRAVIKGGKVVSIDVLDYPSDRRRSQDINRYALPMLQTEVVRAQGANIDIISGATLTWDAYSRSLASALSQAKN